MRSTIPYHLLLFALGCGQGAASGTGSVQAFVVAEQTVSRGLDAGAKLDNVADGWTVRYQKFVALIGNFRAWRSAAPADKLIEPRVYVIDLLNAPASGVSIARFDGIAAERWDKVGFDMPKASSSAVAHSGTAKADYDRMVNNGYSIYFEGSIEKPGGQSCDPKDPAMCVKAEKITFKWGLPIGTSYDECASAQGAAGFAVPTGGSAQVKPTVHGDHWFFNNIPQGSAEITKRLAQWIANCDLDHNGETTILELKMVKASILFAQSQYNLSGGIVPILSAYDYLQAEAHSLGHFNGDGDCAMRSVIASP